MAIVIYTSKPKTLLQSIKSAIDEKKIITWEYDEAGDFTHTTSTEQWENRGWFHPYVSSGILQFGLLGQKKIEMTKGLYGVYHGRFIEMLLTHFDEDFSTVTATSQIAVNVDDF